MHTHKLYFTFLLLGVTFAKTPHCNSSDRNALLQIKRGFNNPPGFFTNWEPNQNCCDQTWDYIECDPTTGRIISFIFIGNSNLPAIFPSHIGKLPYLTTLFFKNNATGPIPPSLSNLTRLEYLVLSDNRLSGPIPPFFGRFKNLALLELGNNQLTGSIPVQLTQLPKLYYISFVNNTLTGRIPTGLFSKLKDPYTSGLFLLLGSNKLRGKIPTSFASVKFREFQAQDNRLTGDASFVLENNELLWTLKLAGNKLSFDMSKVKKVSTSVTALLLNNNKIYGKLPDSLTNLTMLSEFNVSYNRLCGHIPEIGTVLRQFDASAYSHNKCLCDAPLSPCKP